MKSLVFLLALLLAAANAGAQDRALWDAYRGAFITADGRVVDHYQAEGSHSEGQGYGMLLAVAYNDRATFDALWRWTEGNLAVRRDRLFGWLWGRQPNGEWGIINYNNATDGDLLIATALLKASQQWHDDAYRAKGAAIAAEARRILGMDWGGKTLLLPSHYGFLRGDTLILNPAYLILPAYRLFAAYDDRAFWDKAYKDAYYLISKSYKGTLALPPDWLTLKKDGMSDIFRERGSLFGYEAVRLLLYLTYEDTRQFEKGSAWLLDHFERQGYLPLWIDLDRNAAAIDAAPGGFCAIYARVAEKAGRKELAQKLLAEGRKRLAAEKGKDYYSWTLYLLAESGALAVPR